MQQLDVVHDAIDGSTSFRQIDVVSFCTAANEGACACGSYAHGRLGFPGCLQATLLSYPMRVIRFRQKAERMAGAWLPGEDILTSL